MITDSLFDFIKEQSEERHRELSAPYCPYCKQELDCWWETLAEQYEVQQEVECGCGKKYCVMIRRHFTCSEKE
jgi:hypothetical protein